MATFILPSFAKGELTPAAHGRVDTAAYLVSLRTARNAIIRQYGGVSRRQGLMYLGPVKDHDYAPRLITFQFKTTDTYTLEFGDEYMRVIRGDGHVLEASKTITAATQADPCVITAAAHGFTAGQEVYVDSIVGMTRLNGRRFRVGTVTTNTLQLLDQVTGDGIDSTGFTAYSSGGTVARVYEITTPYAQEDLAKLKFVQSADVMTLTHPDYTSRELSRTDHAAWTLTALDVGPSINQPSTLLCTANTTGAEEYRYRVTALKDDTLEESLPGTSAGKTISAITKANPAVITTSSAHNFVTGDEIYVSSVVGMTQINGKRSVIVVLTSTTFSMTDVDSTGYSTYTSGGGAALTFVRISNGAATADNTVSWSAVGNAERYSVYKYEGGDYGWIGDTEALSFEDDNIAPDLSISPPRAKDPFEDDNHPGTVSYFEQRRVFGGSTDNPDASYYSQIGLHDNFNVSAPLRQDDAITVRLNSQQVNEIRHFVPGNDLVVLTSGGEWRVNSGPDAAFAADTIKQKPQTAWGSSHLRPIVVGNTILFVDASRTRVRSLGYSLQIDGYTGSDLSLLAHHLIEGKYIVDWAFSQVPDSRVYMVRSDGKLLTLTFDQEQEVIAWTQWDSKGKFEAVAVTRPSTDEDRPEEEAYVVVKRKVGDNFVRCIERTSSRPFEDIEDCFFVDSGLTFDNPVAITGATAADPVVITAAAHGFSNGDEVDISGIIWETTPDEFFNEVQPDQLNGNRYTVANKTTDTFEITLDGVDVDGTAFAAYVEGGYVRKAATTFTGYDHLEGETVVALADGNVVNDLTVEDGSITLATKASRLHVGLGYVTDIETLNIEAPQGTIQGKLKKISKLIVRLLKSGAAFVGPHAFDMVEMKQLTDDDGNVIRLRTRDEAITLPPAWNSNGRVFIRQASPLPLTILALIPDIIVGD